MNNVNIKSLKFVELLNVLNDIYKIEFESISKVFVTMIVYMRRKRFVITFNHIYRMMSFYKDDIYFDFHIYRILFKLSNDVLFIRI
jgi:uncharacterized radical SAM superfamily protein